MIKLLFIFSVMVLGVVFLIVPDAPPYDFFLLVDKKVTPEWYVYYLIESLIIIIFALYMRLESSEHKLYTTLFLALQIIELIDFILTYNMVWFYYKELPITFNVIKVLVFGSLLAYECIRNFFTVRIA
jgi:hypothetical protein